MGFSYSFTTTQHSHKAYGKDYFLEQPYVPVVTEIILFYEK